MSHCEWRPIEELTIGSIPITNHKGWSVLTDLGWVRFDGEPDADGFMYAEHNGSVYRLSVKSAATGGMR